MIQEAHGNLLDADTQALVNTVNTVGVMGKGIALQFKRAFPENFEAYKRACKLGDVVPGWMFVFDTGQLNPRYIINFPTKRHWRDRSRIEDIAWGLESLIGVIRSRGIRSMASPALGVGLGRLPWKDVRALIEGASREIPDVRVVVVTFGG